MTKQEHRDILTQPRVHLASLGCAKNLVDSERLLARLATAGALVGAPADEADVIIVNTCGFIEPAREESLRTIREYLQHRQTGSCQCLVVMGCLVQRDRARLAAELPEVDGFFGIDEQDAVVSACGLRLPDDDGARLILTPPHTAYLRISDGCDNRCAYCTIPQIRGPFRSRPAEDVLREAEQLVAGGVRELNLIGQDTTLYGVDRGDGVRIHDLLRRLAAIPNLRWLRLLYAHPAHFDERLIDAYASLPKLIPYVDLPLQHLDDDILRRMGRNVTRADCLHLIEKLRTRVDKAVLRTTFIVGFPGETKAQFETLLHWVREVRFDHLGVFPFSHEEETPAARMPNQVPPETARRRVEELMLAQQAIAFSANEAAIGSTVEVLIDEPADEDGGWIARSKGQAPDVDSVTIVLGSDFRPGDFVEVKIVDFDDYDLIAEAL